MEILIVLLSLIAMFVLIALAIGMWYVSIPLILLTVLGLTIAALIAYPSVGMFVLGFIVIVVVGTGVGLFFQALIERYPGLNKKLW